jgi:hypothetical protein
MLAPDVVLENSLMMEALVIAASDRICSCQRRLEVSRFFRNDSFVAISGLQIHSAFYVLPQLHSMIHDVLFRPHPVQAESSMFMTLSRL